MKVNIGRFPRYIGPYQIAHWLQYIGLSENRCDKIGDALNKTFLAPFCEWLEKKRTRRVKIRIDKYDLWDFPTDLAYIVLPVLKRLRHERMGSTMNIKDEDIPEAIRDEMDIHQKWDYLLDQMIYSFEQLFIDWEDQFHTGESDWSFDKEGYLKYQNKIQRGFELFGKYYWSLTD